MIDTALESWAPPTACDVTVGWMPSRPWRADVGLDDDMAADNLWGEGGLDWFLHHSGDVVYDQEPAKIILPLP